MERIVCQDKGRNRALDRKYQDVISFDKLYEAFGKARTGSYWKDSVIVYDFRRLENITRLKRNLQAGEYHISEYGDFTVNERGKSRAIKSLNVSDRVFQHSLCDNLLTDDLQRHYIYDNGAAQRGKGLNFSRNRLRAAMQKAHRKWGNNYYVLQTDIKSYYDSIDHAALKKLLGKQYQGELLKRLCEVVDSYGDRGLSPGGQVVQNIALEYLNGFDHYMKEKERVKFYGRYQDDIWILSNDKDYLQKLKERIRSYMSGIGLSLNGKKTKVYPIRQGVRYLGFHFYQTETGHTFVKVLPETVKRAKKHYRNMIRKGVPEEKVWDSFRCWKGHVQYGNNYRVIKRMEKYIKDLLAKRFV